MTKPQRSAKPPKPYVRKVRQIGLRLPPDLLGRVETLAKADDRNVSYVIRRALAEYLDRADWANNQRRIVAVESEDLIQHHAKKVK